MQALMRMRFGSYTFLQNPAQLQVENRALQQEERLLPGRAPGHGDHRQGLVVRRPCAGDGPGAAAAAFARTGPLAVRPRSGAYAGVFDPV